MSPVQAGTGGDIVTAPNQEVELSVGNSVISLTKSFTG